jgi:hypothetical protein
MAGSEKVTPPPIWDPGMAKRRHQITLTARTVDEFVDWAGSAPMSDVDIVRRSIADGCDDDVVAVLGRELNTLPIVDTSRHNVLLSILGESRREAAIQPLERFIWNVVDVFAPVEFADVTVLSHQVVCDIGINVGLAFRSRAAEMLTYIATARAFDGTLRVIREHPEADVRRAAIDAYLYNHGDTTDAARDVRRYVRDEDQEWVGIPRRTLDSNPDELRERVARLTTPAPIPTQVPRPTPPVHSAKRDHVSTREPEF